MTCNTGECTTALEINVTTPRKHLAKKLRVILYNGPTITLLVLSLENSNNIHYCTICFIKYAGR